MDVLSRAEELILLAVWRLQDKAYCVPIRAQVSEMSGSKWSFGAVYVPLNRLEKRGLIRSEVGGTTPTRGGRSKRYYRLTKFGLRALAQVKRLNDSAWAGIPEFAED